MDPEAGPKRIRSYANLLAVSPDDGTQESWVLKPDLRELNPTQTY